MLALASCVVSLFVGWANSRDIDAFDGFIVFALFGLQTQLDRP